MEYISQKVAAYGQFVLVSNTTSRHVYTVKDEWITTKGEKDISFVLIRPYAYLSLYHFKETLESVKAGFCNNKKSRPISGLQVPQYESRPITTAYKDNVSMMGFLHRYNVLFSGTAVLYKRVSTITGYIFGIPEVIRGKVSFQFEKNPENPFSHTNLY